VIPLVLRRIRESAGSGAGLDIGGLVLVTAAALGVVWGLMRGNGAGWSLEVIAALAAGIVFAVAFVAWERQVREPMVPMRLFRSHAFASGVAASFLFYASMYGTLFFLPQFLQVAQGHGPLGAGLRLLPWTATLFVFAPLGGGLVSRVGERSLVVVGLFLQAIGMAWIASMATPGLNYGSLVAPLIVAGAGVSMAMPAAQNAVLSSVAAPEIGKASGTLTCRAFSAECSGLQCKLRRSPRPGTSAPRKPSAPASAWPPPSPPLYRCWERSPDCGCPPSKNQPWRKRPPRPEA